MAMKSFFSQPWDIQWKTALVRLPRATPRAVLSWYTPEGPQPFTVDIKSRGKHKIPVWVWIPTDLTPAEASCMPVVIDFHGGGFVLGSCLEQAPFCAKLARELRGVVLSVDYRMGPIDKFPAAVEDAEDVLYAVLDSERPGYDKLRRHIRQRIHENWAAARAQKAAARAQKAAAWDPQAPAPISRSPSPLPIIETINLDTTRIALSGFSSGGNLALNLALSIPASVAPDGTEIKAWPSPFPASYSYPIPLLLFYPSFDARQLPSERTRPPNFPLPSGFWHELNDTLTPTYLPRDQAGHLRASPGLASVREDLHPAARMLLILPELDSLAEQSEVWVKKVEAEGRGEDLRVERFKGMKHGWTQMPDGWLGEAEKELKDETYDEAVGFTKGIWEGRRDVLEAKRAFVPGVDGI